MPDQSNNHGFGLNYQSGESWDYNDEFATLEERVEVRGPNSALSDYTPYSDAKFVATDTGDIYIGDGDSWNALGSIGGDPSFGALTFVSDPANLQSAVNNYQTIWIVGDLDVSSVSPIDVGQETCIIGYGTARNTDWTTQNSVLLDNSANPVLEVTGNNARIFGIGIRNDHADGDGIRTTAYTTNISHADIFAGRYGVHLDAVDPASDIPTEPRVNYCRIQSESGEGSGSIGINVANQYDAKLTNNMVCGYDVAIHLEQNAAYVAGSHTYAHPAASYSTGIRSAGSWHRLSENRLEEDPTVAGIECTEQGYRQILGNFGQIGEGADGISYTHSSEIQLTVIDNNFFLSDTEASNVAINPGSTTGQWRVGIGMNPYFGFNSAGLAGV